MGLMDKWIIVGMHIGARLTHAAHYLYWLTTIEEVITTIKQDLVCNF